MAGLAKPQFFPHWLGLRKLAHTTQIGRLFFGPSIGVRQDFLANRCRRGTGILPVWDSTGWKPVPRACQKILPVWDSTGWKPVPRTCQKILPRPSIVNVQQRLDKSFRREYSHGIGFRHPEMEIAS